MGNEGIHTRQHSKLWPREFGGRTKMSPQKLGRGRYLELKIFWFGKHHSVHLFGEL